MSSSAQFQLDFVINFKGKEYKVIKFKASLYSTRFRALTAGGVKSLDISANVSHEVFAEFVNAMQGEEYTITSDNALALFSLSIEWGVATLYSELQSFIDEAIDVKSVVQQILSGEIQADEGCVEFIASNFDKALHCSQLKELPLNLLLEVIRSKRIKIHNMKPYFTFVIDQMTTRGKEACALSEAIDFFYIDREDITKFLEHPSLDPVEASTAIINIIKLHASNVKTLNNHLDGDKICASLQDPSSAIATVTERMDMMKEDVDSLQKRVLKYSISLDNDVKTLNNDIEAISKESREIAKKESETYYDINKKVESLESRFKAVKVMAKDVVPKSPVKPMAKIEDPDDEIFSTTQKTEFPFNEEQPLDGIITALSKECEGNLSDKGIVKITSSSTDHSVPQNVVNRDWNDFWFSKNKVDQWIMFDFGNRRVSLTNYTIKTIKFSEDTCHLKQWCIEGSSDSTNWFTIDEEDTKDLNGSNKIVSFKCNDAFMPYRYLRLRMTGPNNRGDNLLALNNIEFFGVLVDM